METYGIEQNLFIILIILSLVDVIFTGVGMWIAARGEQKGWFIAMLLLNTLGILPALYLIFFQPKHPTATERKHNQGKGLSD